MYTDKWHLSMEPDPKTGEWKYNFTYGYPPVWIRGDCTNPIVHEHPKLKNGQFKKDAMHNGERHYV